MTDQQVRRRFLDVALLQGGRPLRTMACGLVALWIAAASPAAVAGLTFEPSNLYLGGIEVGETSPLRTASLQNNGVEDATSLAETTLMVPSDQAPDADLGPAGSGVGGGTEQYDTVLVSRASGIDGVTSNGFAFSSTGSISADGRHITFYSNADNLHPDDSDTIFDVYVRDLQTNETILVSRASGEGGVKGDGNSSFPSISADGRHITFYSAATTLHPDDPDTVFDVYVRDLQTNETILVSRASGESGVKGNDRSINPSISADGRYITFSSDATTLHPDDTDQVRDVFVRDLLTHATSLVSRATGAEGDKGNGSTDEPTVSADGRYIAFRSMASNLHSDDADSVTDVFVRDLLTHATILVSRASGANGIKGNNQSLAPKITTDGHYVTFYSEASNLHSDDPDNTFDIFVRNLQTDETFLVSRASGAAGDKSNANSFGPSISADGRYVAFFSQATNLHSDDSDTIFDVFLRDLQSHDTILVSRASGADGVKGDNSSEAPSVSADGRYIAFASEATNLHPDDTDSAKDMFVRDIQGPSGQAELVFNPPSLDFGDVEIGSSSAPQSTTLQNTGDMAVTGLLFEAPGSGFDADTTACGPTLTPGEGCEVVVTFTPSNLGPLGTTLTANSDQAASAMLSLAGSGVGGGVPELEFMPLSLDFGDIEAGTTSPPQSATLENTGDADATGLTFGLPPAFDADTSACGIALNAGENCVIAITFTPLAGGQVSADLQVDSMEGASVSLTLMGNGIEPPEPALIFSPGTLNFGEVPVGSTSFSQSATLQNNGLADATGLTFTTTDSGFEADTSECGDTLPAGESCTVSVTFTPTSVGGSVATLEVESAEGAAATLGRSLPNRYLYFLSSALGSGFRMDPADVAGARSVVTFTDDAPLGLAIDPQNCHYYWSSPGDLSSPDGEIRRANVDGTGEEVVHTVTSGFLGDMELNDAVGALYFSHLASIYSGEIGPAGLSNITHLVATPGGTQIVPSLALDVEGNRMYWTADSGVWSANLDGADVQFVKDMSGSPPSKGIALDLQASKIYWGEEDTTDAGDVRIHRANLDGTEYEVVLVLPDFGAADISDIWVDADLGKMFWGHGGHGGHGEGSLWTANLDGSGIERSPQIEATRVLGLTPVPSDIDVLCGQPEADICPPGAACDRVEAIYWHGGLSSGGELWRARADGTYREMLHDWVGGQPSGLDVSRELGKVYWTKTPNEVYRANLDGTDVELVLQLPFASIGDFPGAIRLDIAAGKMFITQSRRKGFAPPDPDRQHATLWRANLDGSDLGVRFVTLDSQNFSFDIDPETGLGYVGIGDSVSRLALYGNAPPEMFVSGIPPQGLYPEGEGWGPIGNAYCELPDPGPIEAKKCYWRQAFTDGVTTAARTYRMDLDGANVEVLPWPDDSLQSYENRLTKAIDGYSGRAYGTGIVADNTISRWAIDDGEDLSLIHASQKGTDNIDLLPAASGGTWATLSLTGVGVAPELVAAPASIDFGAVPIGEIAGPETVALTNAGGAPVQVTNIATAAAPFARIGGDCPATPFELAPAASCTLDYRFAPTSLGDFDQLFAILNSGDPATFVLAGEGVTPPPQIDVDPDNLAAMLASGQTGNQTLTIGNLGEETLEWAVTEDGGVAGTMVAPVRRSAGASAPSASATDLVSLRGSPLPGLTPRDTGRGIVDCDTVAGLVVHDDGTVENGYTGNPDVVASVMFADRFTPGGYPANLSAVCVAFLTMGPTSLDFEIVVVDDDGAGGSPGTELGALPVSASGIPGAVGQPVWFSYDLASLDLSIDSGSVYIGVRWIPANPSVFIASDESVGNPVGFAGGYWWNDNVNAWAATETAFPEYRSLFVRAVVDVIDCTLPAWLAVDPTSGSVAGGGSQTVDVAFDAGSLAPGAYDANLCIGSNDPVNPLTVVPVQLTVSPLAAELSFDPIALDFGNVAVGTTGTLEATLANTGNADADIDFTVGPPGNGFDADTSACGDNLAVGASCPVSVTFTPTAAGPSAATLTVSGDAGASAQLDLAGDGILLTDADVGIAISAMSDYLRPGQIADYLVTLDNAGPAAATGAEIASQLSPDLDIDFASWLCVGPANTGCTPEGVGDLADSGLNLPAGGSVSYLLSAPVRWDAQGPVETSATAGYADDPNPANDSAVAVAPLVVYRDGFEPYGGIATPLLLLEESFGATDTLTLGWPVATSGAQVETVLAAAPVLVGASAAKPAFRLERFHVGPLGWTRLVAHDELGAEYASRWLPVTYGTQATLALADVLQTDEATGESRPQRTVLLFIAAGELQLPLADAPEAYRLWSTVPASINPLGNSD